MEETILKNKLPLKKIILILSLSFVSFFGLYVFLSIYQANNISVVPIDDVNNINVDASPEILSSKTIISGEIEVDSFEEITHINKEKVDTVLYIVIHKQPSLLGQNVFSFTLNDVPDIESIDKISIVSGDVYTSEGSEQGYSLDDLADLTEQKIIWGKD
ncbi:hypothetical protein FM115_10025 [Marinilactibacillus psychrotolerans 42ea]|uniref:Uncharacterized protein n=1 Tax=Marinilactibacillus psychrotolerans 42ea TaxID=1255609 RepID=A0A1R4KH05_9LACT|nr:hypothetical protein FM115_10025 [Marinilactibacillus psychrotolerans 42ea]